MTTRTTPSRVTVIGAAVLLCGGLAAVSLAGAATAHADTSSTQAPLAAQPSFAGAAPTSTSFGTPSPPPSGPAAVPTTGPAWTFAGPQPIANEQVYFTPPTKIGDASGRVTSLAVDPAKRSTVWAGTAGGGVWETTDAGKTWTPMTDDAPNLSIGAVATDATGADVFAGTGEENFNADAIPGSGILESIGGGAWKLEDSGALAGKEVGGLVVDRRTSGTTMHVFAATTAGLLESKDEGTTWSVDSGFASAVTTAGATPTPIEVVQDATNAKRFYATTGGTGCKGAVFESNDSGATWTSTLAPASVKRIAIGTGPGGVAYAMVSNCKGGLEGIYRTTNGTTWSKLPNPSPNPLTPDDDGSSQGWYDLAVGVDPKDADNAVFAGIDIVATTTAGASYTDIGKVYTGGVVHPDFHAIAFSGPTSFYTGNDGGVWSTTDLGGTGAASDWNDLNKTLGVTQYYQGSALDADDVLGGAQDNGGSGFFNGQKLAWTQYTQVGDGVDAGINYQVGSNAIYTEAFGLLMQKGDSSTPSADTSAYPCPGGCSSASFMAPFVVDPTNPNRLLAGATEVYESKVSGTYTGGTPAGSGGWTQISGDLTFDENYGDNFYYNSATNVGDDPITSIAVGPAGESNTIMTASTFGDLYRTDDDFTTPVDITGNFPAPDPKGFVAGWPRIGQITFNPWDTKEAWVTQIATGQGHVYHTMDAEAGAKWTDLTGGLGDIPVTSIVVDPRQPSTVYVGTSSGVYVCTTCGGASASPNWERFGSGFPNVWVSSLSLSRDTKEIIAFTHGRGAWTIPTPDVALRQQVTEFPTTNATHAIADGPGGVWFTENGGIIGRANPDGTVSQWTVPGAGNLLGICLGPDGNMWFTDQGTTGTGAFGYITPDGKTIKEFTGTLQVGSQPRGIAAGNDGNLYITDSSSNSQIYVESTAGTEVARIITPTRGAGPYDIVSGPGKVLYFTELLANKIGAISTGSYAITEKKVPNTESFGALGIGIGPDGNPWYADSTDNAVGVLKSGGSISELSMGGSGGGPAGVATGYDRELWVAMYSHADAIDEINITTGAVISYPAPSGATPYQLVTGPDGNVWFTDESNAAIGMVDLSQTTG